MQLPLHGVILGSCRAYADRIAELAGKSLACDLVGGQRIGVDGRLEPWRNHKLARGETQRLGEQPHLRLQESVELAGVADGDPRDASLHPAAELARKAVAQHGLHAGPAHRIERLAKQIEAAEPFQLELAEADIRNGRRPLHVRELADRLVQHDGNGGDFCDIRVGVPVLGPARLLEQLDARRIERRREAARIGFGKGAVGVDPHGAAAIDGALDRVHARKVVGRILADLDLEGAKAVLEPPLDLLLDLLRRRTVERRQQRQADLAIDFSSG